MLRIAGPILLVFSIATSAGQDSPAIGGSLHHLRFSPDGRYVLAQDDSAITVLNVEPLTTLFRIPVQYATDAQFTPDSGSVVFVAAQVKMGALPTDFSITRDHLEAAAGAQQVEIQKGDVVLLRTGWARFWNDSARNITGGAGAVPSSPGPELEGARWLSSRGVFAAVPILSRSKRFRPRAFRCTYIYWWRAESTSSKH